MEPFKDQFKERSRTIKKQLKALKVSLGETQAGIDKVKTSAGHFRSRLEALDSTEGGYQGAADTLRNSSRQLTLVNHDIEIAVSKPYFEEKLKLEPFSPQDVDSAEGFDFSIVPEGNPILFLHQPAPHDTCYAMGTDDIAIRQEIQITNSFQQSYAPHVWTALGLGVQGLKLRVFPSRGARLCDVVSELDVYERVFPMRLHMMTEVHNYLEDRFGEPQDLTEYVGDFQDVLDDLGIVPHLYDVRIGEQLSFFGRAKGQPGRPLERYAPLPLLDKGWDIGVKIHKTLIEPKIREMVQNFDPEAILDGISFDADNAIRIHATRLYEGSKSKLGVKVTVKVTATAVVKITFSTKNLNQVWALAETESVETSEPDVDIDPDWVGKLLGWMKDLIQELVGLASDFMALGGPESNSRVICISKARKVQSSITENGLDLRMAF